MFDDIRLRPLCANGQDKCPYPFRGDDGSARQCVQRGHCGCGALERHIEWPPRESIALRNARLGLNYWRPRAEDIP